MSRGARKAALTQEEASLCSEAASLNKQLEVRRHAYLCWRLPVAEDKACQAIVRQRNGFLTTKSQ